MRETQRKEIFRCYSGSHLHGTQHKLSDKDYLGIFLPSLEDIFSLTKEPNELRQSIRKSVGPRNTAGDTDLIVLNLRKFLQLASEGQSNQLEMLFTPQSLILHQTEEYQSIVQNRDLFLSKAVEKTFYGFVKSQFNKSIGKSQNLQLIQKILAALSSEEENLPSGQFSSTMKTSDLFTFQTDKYVLIGDCQIPKTISDNGTVVLEVAGRRFDLNAPIKNMKHSLLILEDKYGERTKKAKENGLIDFKSLSHAIRLCEELMELMTEYKITLPRPNSDYLRDVKLGKVDKNAAISYLSDMQSQVPDLIHASKLPDIPDHSKINALYQSIMIQHFS
ncbi:MAG: DNA polymerase beta superfamily protein [Oligoflexus sp.]